MISEERLKEIVRRVLTELGMDGEREEKQAKNKIYMLCTSQWDERYLLYAKRMEEKGNGDIYPVIPLLWKKQGYETVLRSCPSCKEVLYRSSQKPEDLDQSVTVFPVVPRDMVVKAALCMGDTYETAWIARCIEMGSRVVFAENSLARFSGKEPKPYVDQILSYYKTLLTYGIEIGGDGETITGFGTKQDAVCPQKPHVSGYSGKKRVITASNVSSLSSDGIIWIGSNDVVTDLAKDRAKFLNIAFMQRDREVRG